MNAAAAGVPTHVGQSLRRVEDAPLLVGQGQYLDDLTRQGQLAARVVRSDVAHGRLRAIDTRAALALPGVVAAITSRDLPSVRIPVRMLPSEEAKPVTQPPLATDTVRYVGEPIAVVVATDPYRAEDAAGAVRVDIEPLAPILDAEQAAQPGSPALHSDACSGNVINLVNARHGEEVDRLLENAAVVVRDRLVIERQAATPLETRGLLAAFDGQEGRLTVWGPTKVKHFNRTLLAGFLNLSEESIRFVEPDVGGGFGARGEFYPEDFLIPWLAIQLGRPIKWVEDRREHFLAANHSRQVSCSIELGIAHDGELLAFRARCLVDQGAYARTHGTLLLPWILMRHLGGPYRWRGFEIEAASVLTNKTPSGTYRGPSQYESAFFRERMIDRGARELGADPAQVRRRNLIAASEMPLRVELGEPNEPVVYDAGDFVEVLDRVLARADYERLSQEAKRRRAAGDVVGVGLSAHVEEAAYGRYEYARIAPEREDRYVVYVGVASLGQGVRTALGQIAADELRVPLRHIEVVHHDTDLVPQGFGAYASRATVVGGGAVIGAAAELRRNALEAAAERLEISVADLEILPGGVVRPRGQPSGGLTLAELECEGSFRYEQPMPVFDMGATLAVVRVDPDTDAVSLLRLVVCQDVGQMVNPQLVDGQLVGGAAQGVAGTLLERFAYDESGQPLVTSFMDYLMPTAAELPPIEAIMVDLPHHDPATIHPLGVKGCGEGGVVGAGAAIANAVADALGAAMDRVTALPLRPDVVREIRRANPPREE